MRVITYLGFTVLSIFIQFCVMDFIQEKIQLKNSPDQWNISETTKKTVDDFLRNITGEPHALYYRTLINKSAKKLLAPKLRTSERMYSNTSISTVTLGTTDIYTTIFDILYDENATSTESTLSTESLLTTSELENVTGIIFFEAGNKSIPNNIPKINFSDYCGCNLLFQVCDINCCCDPDCINDELTYFQCDDGEALNNDGCISHLFNGDLRYGSSSLDSLFCIVKTNLPDKRNIQKSNLHDIPGHFNKWKDIHQHQKIYGFKKTLYKQNDPIWLLRNGTIYYFDIATPMVNNYCTDRAPIAFLKDEKIQCIVKFNDLEMFHISKTEASMVISANENTINGTALNCSNLHCVNWTILACENGICQNYKSSNEPSCTENNCKNVAFKIDYYFYYYDRKIINATIKLYIEKVFHNVLPFISQEITVKFMMANKSLDNVIKFSGNPGYIDHMQLIVSNTKSNYTNNYFNSTSRENYMILPENHNGICILSNLSENHVRFNLNKRMKCRYVHTEIQARNYTRACKDVQDNISAMLGLNRNISIAPFGNPYQINDKDWIKLEMDHRHVQDSVYGEFSEYASKLHCYNLVDRVDFIFMFASVDGKDFSNQNKILSARYEVVPTNRSFLIEDISLVLTIDTNFIDVTKPRLFEYASSPSLNIHLPKDFFFPFSLNNRSHMSASYIMVIFSCLFSNKITFEL